MSIADFYREQVAKFKAAQKRKTGVAALRDLFSGAGRASGGYEHELARRHKEFRLGVRNGHHMTPSKYVPHQGEQEAARRASRKR